MIRIQAPVRGDAHALQQTLHQLDIGPGQLPILTALNPGRLLHPVSYTHLDVYKRQHGDSPGAIQMAREVRQLLERSDVSLQAFAGDAR